MPIDEWHRALVSATETPKNRCLSCIRSADNEDSESTRPADLASVIHSGQQGKGSVVGDTISIAIA